MKKKIEHAFIVTFGNEGLEESWQAPFLKTVKCQKCDGECRPAVNFIECGKPVESWVANLYRNKPKTDGYWVHDFVAFQVYFCKSCLNPEIQYNQA